MSETMTNNIEEINVVETRNTCNYFIPVHI